MGADGGPVRPNEGIGTRWSRPVGSLQRLRGAPAETVGEADGGDLRGDLKLGEDGLHLGANGRLGDDADDGDLVDGAAEQARRFSWDATAGAMLDTYERARWMVRAEASA